MIRSKYFITLLFLLFLFGSCVVSFGMRVYYNQYDDDRSKYIGEYYNKVSVSLYNINTKDQYKNLIDKYENFSSVVSFLIKDPVKVSSKEYKNTLNEILDKEDKSLLQLKTKCFLIKAYCNVLTDFVKRKIKNIINNYEEKYDYNQKKIIEYKKKIKK